MASLLGRVAHKGALLALSGKVNYLAHAQQAFLQQNVTNLIRGFATETTTQTRLAGYFKTLVKGKKKEDKVAEDAAKEDKQTRDEIIKLLESRKDMDVNGYVMYCREELGKLTVPRPRAPPVSPKHEDYKTFVDEERVTYMRMKQHEKISLFLTEEEKNTVTTKGKDILDDKRFIQTIASRTGFYIAEEVRDCLSEFFNFRDSSRRLLTYYADHANPEFRSAADFDRAMKRLKKEEEDAKRQETLANRDRDACPVIPVLAFAGTEVTCSLTGLKFWECCGAGVTRVPQRDLKRPEKKFQSRAEKKYRIMDEKVGKPRFQN